MPADEPLMVRADELEPDDVFVQDGALYKVFDVLDRADHVVVQTKCVSGNDETPHGREAFVDHELERHEQVGLV